MIKSGIKKIADTSSLTKKFYNEVNADNYCNLNWKKIEHLNFDINEARIELQKIINEYELFNYPISKSKTRYYYKGLSLTSLKNVDDKLKGSFYIYNENGVQIGNENYVGIQKENNLINLKPEYDSDFEFTKACSPFFKNLLDKIKLPITRVRILELMPGGIIPPHIDYPKEYGIKIHAYLKTNDDVVCEVAGEKFKILDDGFFYWMDISKPHSVINLGNTSRISLCINLNPYSTDIFKDQSIETVLNNI